MSYPFSQRMARVAASPIMELLKSASTGGYISFASGLPDSSLFPTEELRRITEEVLTRDGSGALQYGLAEGYPPLRDWVAERLRARGFKASAENILLTNGSQQGLDLTARAFLDSGDYVCVESPTYLAALQAFDSFGVSYRVVSQDEAGMDTKVAEQVIEEGVKLLFALPNFQNPTGRTLSLARREKLAAALVRTGTILLEDDAYYDLRYDGEPLPPIGTLHPQLVALYTGTFSKTIAPGLRVGYIYGPKELIERLTQLKQITDLHTGSLTQRIVYRYVASGKLPTQVEHLCATYRAKRDTMQIALDRHMPTGVQWTCPSGGMFLWITLPEGLNGSTVFKKAKEHGLLVVPGEGFHPDGRGANTLRLNFVSPPREQIEPGVSLLAEVIAALP
jgi:2-aminoadipate transaminase